MENFGFKFEIGDEVEIKGQVSLEKFICDPNKFNLSAKAQRLVICERVLQQCYGGIQRFYRLRAHTIANYTSIASETRLFEISEPELEKARTK